MTTRGRGVNQRARYKLNRNSIPFILALVTVVVLVLLLVGGQNKLTSIRVVRTGAQGSEAYVSDDDIIRASGLKLGDKVNESEETLSVAAKGIDALGYVKLISLARTDKDEITLNVSAREVRAVVKAGGNYALIDDQGYVMAALQTLPTYNIIYVDGAECTDYRQGRRLATKRAKQVDEIVAIVNAIDAMGYRDAFSQLIMKGEHEMYLFTRSNLIVSFYTVDNIERTLELAMGIINMGYETGKIIISEGRASYVDTETRVNSSD